MTETCRFKLETITFIYNFLSAFVVIICKNEIYSFYYEVYVHFNESVVLHISENTIDDFYYFLNSLIVILLISRSEECTFRTLNHGFKSR